jgi:hypothetical protein
MAPTILTWPSAGDFGRGGDCGWPTPPSGFLSPSPLGFAGKDPNLYRYVGNDPTNHTDPSGLSWLPGDPPEIGTPPAPLKVPQGLSEAQFNDAAALIESKAGKLGGKVVVHGSRAAGTAKATSDIDFAIRVSSEDFDALINARFGSPNPGTAKFRTMQHAMETGKIQAGEAGLRGLRKALETRLDMEVDISVIREGGAFDKPPFIPLPKVAEASKAAEAAVDASKAAEALQAAEARIVAAEAAVALEDGAAAGRLSTLLRGARPILARVGGILGIVGKVALPVGLALEAVAQFMTEMDQQEALKKINEIFDELDDHTRRVERRIQQGGFKKGDVESLDGELRNMATVRLLCKDKLATMDRFAPSTGYDITVTSDKGFIIGRKMNAVIHLLHPENSEQLSRVLGRRKAGGDPTPGDVKKVEEELSRYRKRLQDETEEYSASIQVGADALLRGWRYSDRVQRESELLSNKRNLEADIRSMEDWINIYGSLPFDVRLQRMGHPEQSEQLKRVLGEGAAPANPTATDVKTVEDALASYNKRLRDEEALGELLAGPVYVYSHNLVEAPFDWWAANSQRARSVEENKSTRVNLTRDIGTMEDWLTIYGDE